MEAHNSQPVTFERAIPVLPSLDLEDSVAFYTQVGFAKLFSDPDGTEPYAIIERDGIQIHFWECDDPVLPSNSSCRIQVADVETFYETFERPTAIFGELTETPFGTKEFVIKDPHENLMWFFEGVPQE